MAGRTIVVSDLHGFNSLLESVLDDAGFGPGDSLVVAGDLVDIGTDDTIAAAEKRGATILAGNHEVSAALGVDITPQNADTPARGPEFAERFLSGEWPLAAAVNGWLITHAGLSGVFYREVESSCHEAECLAPELNAAFRAELRRFLDGELSMWSVARSRLLGSEFGPLWFRPERAEWVPDGLKQITGHTPCELIEPGVLAALKKKPFLIVDPGAHLGRAERGAPRYGVIEADGSARVVTSCS